MPTVQTFRSGKQWSWRVIRCGRVVASAHGYNRESDAWRAWRNFAVWFRSSAGYRHERKAAAGPKRIKPRKKHV